jgi:uncharacterized membrane protein
MESRVRVARHPLHPILVMFPTALLPLLLFMDALLWWTGDAAFWTAGSWVAIAGVAMTLLAIGAGIPDMMAIPDGHRAHRTGIFHAIVGTTILVVFVASMWARWNAGTDRLVLAGVIDLVGVLLVSVQGWLGAELVYRHHLGVRSTAEGADPVALTSSEAPRGARADARRPGV